MLANSNFYEGTKYNSGIIVMQFLRLKRYVKGGVSVPGLNHSLKGHWGFWKTSYTVQSSRFYESTMINKFCTANVNVPSNDLNSLA